MKRLALIRPPVFFSFAGKFILTLVVVLIFLAALGVVLKARALFRASQSQQAPPIYVNNASPSSKGSAVRPFWPEFPRTSARTVQSAVINGTQIITEEWEGYVSALDVLAYYREQMIARGWRDNTEATYSLQPELNDVATAPQDEQYVSKYREVMDSTLMLNREGWSLHIATGPGIKDPRKTAVKFYAAAAPTIQKFVDGLGSAIAPQPGATDGKLDAVQQNGREKYHTTIATSRKAPLQAFQEKLTHLDTQGWRPIMFLPKEKTPNGFFAWLVRGKQYAALSVKTSPQGSGSSVTFTEVTPD